MHRTLSKTKNKNQTYFQGNFDFQNQQEQYGLQKFQLNKNPRQQQQSRKLLTRKGSLKTIHSTLTSAVNTTSNSTKRLSLHKKDSNLNIGANLNSQEQMNQLYEQNQKLGYRINYLSDENNFYRISINNIEKLNNKIKKDLDANQLRNIQNQTIKTQTKTNFQKNNHYFQQNSKLSKKPIFKGQTTTNNNQWNSALNSQTNKKQQRLSEGWKGSSLKLISNKIHLKNLQMKVGNSIRQTQKLKKVYEGSLSSLNKKAQDLEDEINKLARECEYYCIEAELLKNIYKADFYINFNSDWLSLYKSAKLVPKQSQLRRRQKTSQQSKGLISEQDHEIMMNEQQQESIEIQNLIQPHEQHFNFMNKNNFKRKPLSLNGKSNTKSNTKREEINQKRRLTNTKMNENLGAFGEINSENYPMAIRFLSFSYKHNMVGNTNTSKSNSGWYSTLYPKYKVNKLLEMIDLQSLDKDSSANHLSTNKNLSSQYNKQSSSPQQHMTEKQLFLLPESLVKFVLTSLQKEEIQQNNKLQSLRKQQKDQRKNHSQLTLKIQDLSANRKELKRIVDEEFAQFFIRNVQRLDIISSAVNSNSTNILLKMGRANEVNKKSRKQLQLTRKPSVENSKNNLLLKKQNGSELKQVNPHTSIYERKHEADQLLICGMYEKQLIEQISRQEHLLQEQFRINQQYKQKIVDRNEQQSKEIKVLEQEVNKCHQQLNQLTANYKLITQNKVHIQQQTKSQNFQHRHPTSSLFK